MRGKTTRFARCAALGVPGFALSVLLAGACGGGSNNDGGNNGTGGNFVLATTAPDQCKQFVAAFCRRATTCLPSQTDGGNPTTICNTDYAVAFNCAQATSTMFGDCIKDINTLSCSGLGLTPDAGTRLPASCDDPTNITSTPAQNNCATLVAVLCDPVEICAQGPNANPQDPNFPGCFQQGIFDLACPFAIGESATFNNCLDDLCATAGNPDAGVPDGGFAVPQSCQNPIVYPPM